MWVDAALTQAMPAVMGRAVAKATGVSGNSRLYTLTAAMQPTMGGDA